MRLTVGDTGLMSFAYLALHEDTSRTLSEIAAAVGRSPQVAQSALRTLIAEEVVLTEDKPLGTGRGALYTVNTRLPIFPELRQIAIKLLGGSDQLRAAVGNNTAIEAAAIFGSMASGSDRRAGAMSDIDLLLIFSGTSTRDQRFTARAEIYAVAERLGRDISVEALTRSEWNVGRTTNRVLRRIAEGQMLILKGSF